MLVQQPIHTLFPYTTLFRSAMNLMNVVTADAFGVLALRMRSIIRGERVANAGDKRFWRGAKRALSVSNSGCRLFLAIRSEEHTSELQSLRHLVCRLLLVKKN